MSLFLTLVACGGGSDTDTDAGPRDGGGADAMSLEPSDLGQPCAFTCNLDLCVTDSDACEDGVCVYSAALGGAHCTRLCEDDCRAGYQCVVAEDFRDGAGDDGQAPVCLSEPAVCGNGSRQFGEACDDGNTLPDDFCAADCSEETLPPSGGTIIYTFHDSEPMTLSGNEPTVTAHRIDGRLFFTGRIDYAFALPDDLGPAPTTVSLSAGVVEAVNGNLCSYQGSTTAQIRALDHTAKTVAGSASMVLYCQSGVCNSGCVDEVPHTVDFDLRWVERDQ